MIWGILLYMDPKNGLWRMIHYSIWWIAKCDSGETAETKDRYIISSDELLLGINDERTKIDKQLFLCLLSLFFHFKMKRSDRDWDILCGAKIKCICPWKEVWREVSFKRRKLRISMLVICMSVKSLQNLGGGKRNGGQKSATVGLYDQVAWTSQNSEILWAVSTCPSVVVSYGYMMKLVLF